MKKLILYDINKSLCDEWNKYFKDEIEKGLVEVQNVTFKDLKCNYVATAGNSYGWMTGGIDLAVRQYYGQGIQDIIQHGIISECSGELPVGSMMMIDTQDNLKPHLLYAPTMRVPSKIEPIDVFYVFFKILTTLYSQNEVDELACCGLGTSTGGVSVSDCAKMMYIAYKFIDGDQNEIATN